MVMDCSPSNAATDEGSNVSTRKERGKKSSSQTSLEGWLHDEGVHEEVTASAIKHALATQLEKALAEDGLTKTELARRMQTSRPALDRLLDPDNEGVTLATLEKAARAVGRTLRLELLSKWLHDRPLDSTAHAIPIVLVDDRKSPPREKRVLRQPLAGSAFFEVNAEQISDLDPHQIVELLRRLITAELVDAGIPLRSASVPSEINIPDGGVDGRVRWYGGANETDYLPSRYCIFQSKVRDPGPAKLQKEVWKKSSGKSGKPPELSGAMVELLERSGSYIIVTGSQLSDSMVQSRIDALRQAIKDAGGQPDHLTAIDIYHADVLVDWTNSHPSIALWVNEILRNTDLSGFQTYEQWGASADISDVAFVHDDEPRFSLSGDSDGGEHGATKPNPVHLAFAEMAQNLTGFLSGSQKAVRIVGPSGYGKTRAAFQLFSVDQAVRADCLESTSVVFANYDDVKDRLASVVLGLAISGAATTLVIDDCPDTVHQDILKKARRDGSRLRIITLDVETNTQQSKHNLVIEVGPASRLLIEKIAEQKNPAVSGLDVQFIQELSQGFPRMAILAAEALGERYDALSTINELIDRVVWGRQVPDEVTSRALELASLLAFVGVDGAVASELEALAAAAELSPLQMRTSLLSLRPRGIIVRRGDYLEVQPLPLAARLGAKWLERMPSNWLPEFYNKISNDMQMRLLRRLRWLDRSQKAVDFADRVLASELNSFDALNTEDGARRLERLVHVDPNRTMATLEHLLGAASKDELQMLTEGRRYVVWALEKLAFRRATFVAAATLLRRLGAAEKEDWGNNAAGVFVDLYQLYLGGTEAEPAMRLQVLRAGLASKDYDERKLCVDALGQMLRRSHFTRSGGSEQIGSAAPLIDWRPTTWGEIFSFHREALEELRAIARSENPLADAARNHIGLNIRGLLSLPALFDDVRRAILEISDQKDFWPRSIIGVNEWLYFDRKEAPKDYADKVRNFYDELTPDSPIELALLYCSGWSSDLHDPDRNYAEEDRDFDYAERQAIELADRIAHDDALLDAALSKLTSGTLNGVAPFARRLAELLPDPIAVMKKALYAVEHSSERDIEYRFFGGFLSGTDKVSHESALACFALLRSEPVFQSRLANLIGALRLDPKALSIVVEMLEAGTVQPEAVSQLSFGRGLDHLEAAEIAPFFEALIATGTGGLWAALEALFMYQHWRTAIAPEVIALFKSILFDPRLFLKRASSMGSHHFEEAVALLHRHGRIHAADAEKLMAQILRLGTDCEFDIQLHFEGISQKILRFLVNQYPNEVWNRAKEYLEIDDKALSYRMNHLLQLEENFAGEAGLLNDLPQEMYSPWLKEAPAARLHRVLGWVPLIQSSGDGRERWHPDLEGLVDNFATKNDDLAVIERRLLPNSWSGSLADQLEPHLPLLMDWWNHPKMIVRNWALNVHMRLSNFIADERRTDANREIGYRS